MDESKDTNEKPSWTDGVKTYALPVAAAGLAVAAVPAALSLAGFGAGGVVAGSAAAKMMSVMGTSGYVVPLLQSAGAAGTALSTKVVVGGGAFLATHLWKKDDSKQ